MRSIPRTRTRTRTRAVAFVAVAVALVVTACLPAAPSAGRATPVRKVALIGDSLTWGLFGTTPTVEGPLRARLAASGISLTLDGGPGDTLERPWPGHANWADLLQARINQDDPDVVIIQSILFPGFEDSSRHAGYRAAASRLLDIAQSRGAHVYLVHHHRPNNPTEYNAAVTAEQLQAEVSAGRGVSAIPLNWWLARCPSPYAFDGWHLGPAGENCWADAVNAAVNQLRNQNG